MDTGPCDPSDPIGVQTFVVRIYGPRIPRRGSPTVSGTVENIPDGSVRAFDGIRQLGALLDLTGTHPKKSAAKGRNRPCE